MCRDRICHPKNCLADIRYNTTYWYCSEFCRLGWQNFPLFHQLHNWKILHIACRCFQLLVNYNNVRHLVKQTLGTLLRRSLSFKLELL